MRQRRRKTVSEINLTPLLDILFSILFIIMMTSMQNEAGLKEEHQKQIEQMESEISDLEKEIDSQKDQIASHDKYKAEAIIVTVNNTAKDGKHYLAIKEGMEPVEVDNIQLGINKKENIKARINDTISSMAERVDNQPVYIVFYCDKKIIYTAEFRVIEETFMKLQETYKEVFFKVMEVE